MKTIENKKSTKVKIHTSIFRIITQIFAILLTIFSLVLLYLTILNIHSEVSYNEATDKLISNAKSYSKSDADIHILHTQQQQTDSQFEDAYSNNAFLLPDIKKKIEINAKLSRDFTKKLEKLIVKENSMNKPNNSNKNSSSNSSNNSKNNSENNKKDSNEENNTDGNNTQLSNDQKQKVENLLNNNNHSEHQYDSDKNNNNSKTQNDSNNKPW